LQEWDIAHAERPIFREWLKMALVTGAVPLPVEKFRKFYAVNFTGRRWAGVDPVKESNAKATDLANKFTSLQRIHDEQGTDLEDTLREIAEGNMMMESYGIESATTAGPMVDQSAEELDAADAAQTTPKAP
jgi:capsid protein